MTYYDYDLQVWADGARVVGCNHPERMGANCCNGRRYKGLIVAHARVIDNFGRGIK